jgi:membrane-bound lytic murein transglycosylase C
MIEGQVANRKGEKVKPENLEMYLKDEVLPDIQADPVPFQSRDGIKRRRYIGHVDLVPNHIRIRAERYLPIVHRNAARFSLKPELILAIIHTESHFNPMALSPCNAVGIMQIIPEHAGREAYRFVYKRDEVIRSEYLYNPENNIELGSAYLHLLRYQHFSDVKGDLKNRYVSICGYNWGPTSMRKKIVDRYPISTMSTREVYKLLRRKTPNETREYIQRVTERMPMYSSLINRD